MDLIQKGIAVLHRGTPLACKKDIILLHRRENYPFLYPTAVTVKQLTNEVTRLLRLGFFTSFRTPTK